MKEVMNKTQGFRVELQVSGGGGVTGNGQGIREGQDRTRQVKDNDKTETRWAQDTAFRGIKKFSGGGWLGVGVLHVIMVSVHVHYFRFFSFFSFC